MIEFGEDQFDNERGNREQMKKDFIALAIELSEGQEVFPFPGIDPEAREKLKQNDEEYPGYVTPIDDLEKKFEEEDLKVVLGNDPKSGNVFVLPALSEDVVKDSVSPRHLKITDKMDDRLKKLINMSESLRKTASE